MYTNSSSIFAYTKNSLLNGRYRRPGPRQNFLLTLPSRNYEIFAQILRLSELEHVEPR